MRPINELSDIDAGYLAGIIDGEETIGLTRIHSRKKPSTGCQHQQ